MAWLLRKSATLLAVYSIALQAMLWGFAPPGHFGLDPFAIVCTTDGSGEHQPTPAQHRNDCDACLAACGGSPALIPTIAAFSFLRFGDGPKRPSFLAEPLALQPRHQPHESRAPPIPS
jgi:Protein of unknown function (DUF2946)